MEQIKIMSAFEAAKNVYGNGKYIFTCYFLIPFAIIGFAGGGLGLLLFGDNILNKTIGLLLFLAIVYLCVFYLRERNYKPGKSYFLFRGSKELIMKKQIKIAIGSLVICLIVAIANYINFGNFNHLHRYIFILIAGGFYLYNLKKSFNVHEDVDFVTSSEMESLVGVEIGEKIQATYQNFDSSTGDYLKDDAYLVIVSDKRIYFSYVENGKWSFMRKTINEITKMAIIGDTKNEDKTYLKLVFSDETRIILSLETFEKMTSNKFLFLKKFLDVLDAVVLGTVDEKISSRRRVSVNQETKPIESHQGENKEIRILELSNDVMEKLRNATPVEAGRVLEF